MSTLSEAVRETRPTNIAPALRSSTSGPTSGPTLHLTGSLSSYIGAHIAESGYVGNRDLEFTESRKPPKSEVLQKFDPTIAMVIATIEKQAEPDWTAPFSGDAVFKNRLNAFLRLAGHLYQHTGQIIYLSRELQKS